MAQILQKHAEWAAAIRANPVTQCPMQKSELGVMWLVDPLLARDMIGLLEADDNLPKPTANKQTLLREALTSVSGADWKRQRPVVIAAIGGGQSVQERRHQQAVVSATSLAMRLITQGSIFDVPGSFRVPDIIDWASKVASRGIVSALLGPMVPEEEELAAKLSGGVMEDLIQPHSQDVSRPSLKDRLELEELIVLYLRSTRKPRHQRDSQLCDKLEILLSTSTITQVERCYQLKEVGDKLGEPNNSLMMRLALRPELSKSEVAGNCNSVLLAGVETTYTLMATTLLHLSQSQVTQEAVRQEAGTHSTKLISSVLKETLRINPPVMGQPRIVDCPDGVSIVRLTTEEKFKVQMGKVAIDKSQGVSYFIPQGTLFAVDLLSAAHGKPQSIQVKETIETSSSLLGCCFKGGSEPSLRLDQISPEADVSSSWTFCPDGNNEIDESCPFGIGARGCPAGSLSLVIVREVIVMMSQRFKWILTNQIDDEKWQSRTKRVPTLFIDGPPVSLNFCTQRS